MSVDPYPGLDAAQPFDPTLTALSGLSTGPDVLPYFTDVDTAGVTPLTPFARSLLDDPDAATWKATLDFGTGQANKVAVWGDTDTLTYDTELHWDSVNNRLGINQTVPLAPLSFAATLGQKIHLYASGNDRYGLAIAASQLMVFGGDTAKVSLGNLSASDGSTFTARLDVEPSRVTSHVPLKVASNTGLAYDPPGNVWVRTGSMSTDSLRVGGGDVAPRYTLDIPSGNVYLPSVGVGIGRAVPTDKDLNTGWGAAERWRCGDLGAPRWPLDCVGDAHIARLGIWYAPPTTVYLRSGAASMDSLYLGGGDVAPRWTLDVEAAAMIRRLGVGVDPNPLPASCFQVGLYAGFGYAPVSGYSIRAGNSHFDALGAGYAGGSGYALRVTTSYIDHLGVGTDAVGGWNLAANSILAWDRIQANNNVHSAGTLSSGGNATIGGVVTANGWANTMNCLLCNYDLQIERNSNLRGIVGVGGWADGSWTLRCYGQAYFDGMIKAAGSIEAGYSSTGMRFANVGSTQGNEGFSNWIGIGFSAGLIYMRVDATQFGWVTMNGSDQRMKRDIVEDAPGLDAVLGLRPVSFAWDQTKRPIGFPEGRFYGLIAQDVEPYAPLAVRPLNDGNGWLMVDYPGLVPVLVNAIKALHARLASLEETLA